LISGRAGLAPNLVRHEWDGTHFPHPSAKAGAQLWLTCHRFLFGFRKQAFYDRDISKRQRKTCCQPYRGHVMPNGLTETDYKSAAQSLGVLAAAIKAVATVESQGDGFLADGRPKILFERHVMYSQLSQKYGKAKADQYASQYPDIVNSKAGGYSGGIAEHDRLGRAAKIDRECALSSASWGGFQIMGYHWKNLGYPNQQAFINAMYSSEAQQLDAFVRFIKADSVLVRALRNLDWVAFAKRYNGPAYAKNKYDEKMSTAYKKAGGEVV